MSNCCAAAMGLLLLATGLSASVTEHPVKVGTFGKTSDGQAVSRYVLTNHRGVEAVLINYGAALVSLRVPDRNGKSADIVLGYEDVAGYEKDKAFFGASIGRYGNRIARGEFTLDGTTFHLPKNDGPNSLHGGSPGFNKRLWTAADHSRAGAQSVEFSYSSPDGEEGYPGKLQVSVTYTLTADKNELQIDYRATSDKDTVVNLTNHSYFNLSGDMSQEILKHELLLHASAFTPVDETLIPTGELRAVKGTPFDFTRATAIGSRINEQDEQLKFGRGYDHNWVLQRSHQGGLHSAAEVYENSSGRILEVLTTEPGVQFYSGNFLDGTAHGKGGQVYKYRTGFCLETQHFPDSPNHQNFPSTVLKAGQTYRSNTVFRFSTRKS